MKNIEVEITFPLKNKAEVIENLKQLNISENKTEYQKDTYFNAPHKDFLAQKPIADWLRVRETEHSASINFKHWHNEKNAQAVSCDEYESEITDAEAVKNIFKSLDIKEMVVVEKKRSIWMYKDVEIAFDDVEDLGNFIELEAKGDFESIVEAEKHLRGVLEELGAEIGEQDYKGYPFLILEKQGYRID